MVLIACEESQRVCTEFRNLGIEAYSCDIFPCSGGHPEWHIKDDAQKVINGFCTFVTQDGFLHRNPGKWDLIIAHPPCTYLTVSGNRWFNEDVYGEKARERKLHRVDAIKFFMAFVFADCDRIAIENPIGVMSSVYRKPDQIIQPYQFGDSATKSTCLWLKNVPCLEPTNIVGPGEFIYTPGGKKIPKWYSDAFSKAKTAEERRWIRSKTFPGIAKAMAEQWSNVL